MVGPTLQLLALSALCVGAPAGEFRGVLERLNITQYAPALRAEDIGSPSDLAALSGDDMEALGLRIGARNRLRAWQRAQLQQHGAGGRSATTAAGGGANESCPVLVGDACFAGLAAAIGAAGPTVRTVVVRSQTAVSSAITVPPTMHVQMTGTGLLVSTGAGSVTFQGSLEAPLRQVFRGFAAGGIGLAEGSVAQAFPQWWGAKGDSVSDDALAIQSAIDASNIVNIPPGNYKVSTTLVVNNRMGFTLAGAGIQTTSLTAGTRGMVLLHICNTMCKLTYFPDLRARACLS